MQLLIPPFRLPINTKGVLLGMEGRKEGWKDGGKQTFIASLILGLLTRGGLNPKHGICWLGVCHQLVKHCKLIAKPCHNEYLLGALRVIFVVQIQIN